MHTTHHEPTDGKWLILCSLLPKKAVLLLQIGKWASTHMPTLTLLKVCQGPGCECGDGLAKVGRRAKRASSLQPFSPRACSCATASSSWKNHMETRQTLLSLHGSRHKASPTSPVSLQVEPVYPWATQPVPHQAWALSAWAEKGRN